MSTIFENLVDNFWRLCYTNIMNLAEKIYQKLDSCRGKSVSGAEFAREFGVSRNAVWKAVKQLRTDGIKITAVTNRGYTLEESNNVLTVSGIQKYISFDGRIIIEKSVGSTNDEVKKLALAGAPQWSIVIAEEQTCGRGRYGRAFYSPYGSGLYVSILLRPEFAATDTLYITTSAAVAVCEAIETVCTKKANIKWVNDILIDNQKVCGILTEASYNVENNRLDYAIVGIGINVTEAAFPPKIKEIATSLFGDGPIPNDCRAKLAGRLLERFRYYYERIPTRAFYREYRRRMLWIGLWVEVNAGNRSGLAQILDLDEHCFLKVRFQDGMVRSLSSGEVSIRPYREKDVDGK